MRKPIIIGATALLLAGCGASAGGGGGNGSLTTALNAATAPFAVLDLGTRTFIYRADIPDLATNPAYRANSLVFHRAQVGGNDVLIGAFELTQAQWQAIDATQPWSTLAAPLLPAAAADQPACNIDYDIAIAALAAFTLAGGAHLDLPTAAEWSAACGSGSGWSWGATTTLAQLQAAAVVYETAAGSPGPRPVGTRSPNAGGFYDLHGNVWEWNKPGDQVRGGSWADSYWLSRADAAPGAAQGLDTAVPHALIGVRLVLRP